MEMEKKNAGACTTHNTISEERNDFSAFSFSFFGTAHRNLRRIRSDSTRSNWVRCSACVVHVMFVEFRLHEKCQPSTVLQSWTHFPIEFFLYTTVSACLRCAFRFSETKKKNQIKMQFSSARDFQWFSSRATFRFGICSSFNLPRLPPHPNTLSFSPWMCVVCAGLSSCSFFYLLNI